MTDNRLGSVDASFLELEKDGPSATIGTRIVLEGEPPSAGELREFVLSRRDRAPKLFQRIERSRIPVANRGKWVDTDVDLNYHIQIDEIGDNPRGFDGAVARIMSTPLDHDRPLWTIHLFPTIGEPGHWGLVWIIHHTIADGQGVSVLVGNFLDLTPEGAPTMTEVALDFAHKKLDKEPVDDAASAGIVDGVVGQLSSSFSQLKVAAQRTPATIKSFTDLRPKLPTELTGVASEGRSNVCVSAPLSDAKRTGKAVGSTVNDVVMAAVAASFTELLRAAGTDVEGREIRCLMPVSMRDPRNDDINNQVVVAPVVLPLGIDDPVERLKVIHKATMTTKTSMQPLITDQVAGLASRWLPNALQEAGSAAFGVVADLFCDTVLTNVPGPQFPLYFMGRHVLASFPIMPVVTPLLFLVAITSYDGMMNISVTSDDRHWDDATALAHGIRDSLNEMAMFLAT